MLRCELDVWSVDLESSWDIKRHVFKVCTKFERNRAISGWIIDNFANFCTHYVSLWLWPLTSWLELLQPFGCHTFKLCTKFERKWIVVRWVIDDLARFRCSILRVGHDWQTVIRGAWTQLHQTWWGHRAIIPTKGLFSALRYLAAFSNAIGSNLSDVQNDSKFRTFLTPVKIRAEWARSLYQLLKLYLRPNLRNTSDIHPLRGCWARWIDKKEKKRKFIGKT